MNKEIGLNSGLDNGRQNETLLRERLHQIVPVNVRKIMLRDFPGFKPHDYCYYLSAVEKFRGIRAIERTQEQIQKMGIDVEVPISEPFSKRYEAGLWGAAVAHAREGNDDYLEQLLKLNSSNSGWQRGRAEFNSRILGHIQRLIDPNRTEVEQGYGLDFLRYYPDFYAQFGKAGVLETEGSATTLCWTLLPYLSDELKAKGHSPRRSTYLTLRWAQLSNNDEGGFFGFCLYQGKAFCLSEEDDITHRVARKLARELIDNKLFVEIDNSFVTSGFEEVLKEQEKKDLFEERKKIVRVLEGQGSNWRRSA